MAYIKSLGRTRGPSDERDLTGPRSTPECRLRIKSWLLTTDHKRIGILFMISITFFFFIGAAAT